MNDDGAKRMAAILMSGSVYKPPGQLPIPPATPPAFAAIAPLRNPAEVPEWMQSAAKSAFDPLLRAGEYLGGILQGSQSFHSSDALQHGAALAMALMGGKSPMAKSVAAPIKDEINNAVKAAIASQDGYHYGLRVTPTPLEVGKAAPPSRNWYSDFISEDHPVFGRDAFPDHGEALAGPSTLGIRSVQDIDAALQAAGVVKKDYGRASPYGSSTYDGDHVSLIRSDSKIQGADPGEWIQPDGHVVATWSKPR